MCWTLLLIHPGRLIGGLIEFSSKFAGYRRKPDGTTANTLWEEDTIWNKSVYKNDKYTKKFSHK